MSETLLTSEQKIALREAAQRYAAEVFLALGKAGYHKRKCRLAAHHEAHIWRGLNTRHEGYFCPGVLA